MAWPSVVLFGGVPLVWLAVVSALYLRAAALPLRHAEFLGVRQALPELIAIAALVMGGLVVGVLRRPLLSRLYVVAVVGGAALLILAIPVAGQTAVQAGIFLWLVVLGWAVGDRILGWLFGRSSPPQGVERATFSIAVALGLYSHATLGLAIAGWLDRWLVGLGLLVVTVLLWRDLRDKARLAARNVPRVASLGNTTQPWFVLPLLGLLASWAVIIFVEAIAPEVQFDSLNYHLAFPKIYLDEGRLVTIPYQIQTWYYLGTEMNYLLGMLLADQVTAKLFNPLFLALTVSGIFTVGRRFISDRVGAIGAALYVTTPLVAWEASTTYIEVALSCYCFLTALALASWLADRRLAWCVLAGLLAGFALSTKVNAVLFLGPLGAVLLVVALTDRRTAPSLRWLAPLAFSAAALLSGAPWPILRYAQTGNPIFPILNGVFNPVPAATLPTDVYGFAYGIGRSDFYGLLRLPWDVTFSSDRFAEAVPASVLGLGLLALPLLVFSPRVPRSILVLAVVGAGYTVAWVLTLQYLRFYLPALPIVSLLAALALVRVGERASVPSARRLFGNVGSLVALAWIGMNLPLFLATLWNVPDRIPWSVVLGRESRDSYLSQAVISYDAFRFLDATYAGTETHTLSLGNGQFRLYSEGIVETQTAPAGGAILHAASAEDAVRLLRKLGFTHLLIDRNDLSAPLAGAFVTQKSFLDRYADLEFARRNVEVYRVLDPGEETAARASAPRTELLANGSFEVFQGEQPAGWNVFGRPTLDASGVKSHTGLISVEVSPESGFTQAVAVEPGALYTVSNFSRADLPNSNVRGQINWLDRQGKVIDASINVFPATGEWEQHEVTATAPEGAATAVVYANAHTGRVWLDDSSLVRQR